MIRDRLKVFSFNRHSLRMTLVFYVVAPLLIAAVLASYVGLRTLEATIEERMQEDIELIGRAIRVPVSRAIEAGNRGGVNRALNSVFTIHRVYGAYVYDSEGRKVAAAGIEDPIPQRTRLSQLAAEGSRKGEYGEIAGRQVYSYFLPLADSAGRINGLLQVTRRKSDIENDIGNMRMQAAGLLLVACLLLSGLVLYGHHGAVGRHLVKLAKSMARIGQGERRHRAMIEGPEEIRAVSSAMNSMLDSIEEAEREIERRSVEQMSLEARLKQAEKLAAIGRLAAGVAHELGAPLSIIHGKAQRALRNVDIPAPFRTTLEQIRPELRRMEHIVHQLLEFGRRDSSRKHRIAVDRLAQTSAELVKEESHDAGVVVEMGGTVPAPHVMVDPVRLEQALVNLLRNAIQATKGKGCVSLAWSATDRTAEFIVEDNGPGVTEDIRSRIFEPFFTTKPKGQGTGLGLAVVHAVAEEHGGQIEIGRSRLGGARFRLVLPVSEGANRNETF